MREATTSVIPKLAHTRGPGALRHGSSGLLQIQEDTSVRFPNKTWTLSSLSYHTWKVEATG